MPRRSPGQRASVRFGWLRVGRRSNGLALAAVSAILGFLVVVQLQSQAGVPGLQGRSSQELTVLIGNLSTHNGQLRQEIAVLERQVAALAAGGDRGESSVDAVRTDLRRVRAWVGMAPVRGPGVEITIAGPLPGDAVSELLNELRNAGAEALDVDGVRLVPGSVVAGPAGALTLDGQSLPNPLRVRAIGSPVVRTGSLTRVSGPLAVLDARFPDVLVEVVPADVIELPASERNVVPVHGQPRL